MRKPDDYLANSRRRFLGQLMATMGTLIAAGGRGPRMAHAQDAISARRHLINIFPAGASGFDGISFHTGMNAAELRRNGAAEVPYELDGEHNPSAFTSRTYGGNEGRVHPKYTGIDPNVYLGPGMSVFDNVANQTNYQHIENNMLLLNGLRSADGGHTIGSHVLNCGNRSRYAASFSSLIAVALGARNPLPLHFVQLSAPGTMDTHTGLVGGLGEPVCISDPSSLEGLTSQITGDLPEGRRKLVESTFNQLVEIALGSRLKQNSNRTVYSAFASAYNGMNWLLAKGLMANGSLFRVLWAEYKTFVTAQVRAHPYFARYGATRSPSITDVSNLAVPNLDLITFRFALSEYLVRENLSAVIDIPGLFVDAHWDNDAECVGLLATYSCLRRLLDGLKGADLLGVTTVTMFTEFDRTPTRIFESRYAVGNPGVGHGITSSVVMAGAGVVGGRVVGGLRHRPLAGQNIGCALPIDFRTGRPFEFPVDQAGRMLDDPDQYAYIEHFFPTMLGLFGVRVPESQITAYNAIEAITKA